MEQIWKMKTVRPMARLFIVFSMVLILVNSKGLQYLNILDNVFLFEYQLVCNM